MSKVTILLAADDCEICGQEVPSSELTGWNGKEVCKFCIQEINRESESNHEHYY